MNERVKGFVTPLSSFMLRIQRQHKIKTAANYERHSHEQQTREKEQNVIKLYLSKAKTYLLSCLNIVSRASRDFLHSLPIVWSLHSCVWCAIISFVRVFALKWRLCVCILFSVQIFFLSFAILTVFEGDQKTCSSRWWSRDPICGESSLSCLHDEKDVS